MKKKVTVITINLNNLEGLKRTAESVIAQTSRDFEYIVIDGGSTDGSREYIARLPRVDYWVSEPDKGIYNAMNKAVRMAQGEYCIFMNSGDAFFAPDVLDQVIPLLNGGDFYVGQPMLMRDDQMERGHMPDTMTLEFLLEDSINHQCTFTRTAILKESPYNENNKIVSDWEKFFREWLFHDRSYIPMDITVACYNLEGISNTDQKTSLKEKWNIIHALIPPSTLEKLRPRKEEELTPLEKKIKKAMSMPPVSRDLKLLRNAFKFLCKDSFRLAKEKLAASFGKGKPDGNPTME